MTNDKNLRKLCQQESVPTLWGLELLIELHKAGGIPGKNAEDIAHAIQKSNPKYITPQILAKFLETIQRTKCILN